MRILVSFRMFTKMPMVLPGERVLPYMGYTGKCHGIEYEFGGPQSLNRVSFLPLLAMCQPAWSLDRVPKLYKPKP